MGDFTRFSFGANPDAPTTHFIEGRAPAQVMVHNGATRVTGRSNDVEGLGLARASAADTSKFSGAGFTTATGGPIIGREIGMDDRYTDPETGIEMTVATALSAGLLNRG